MPEGVDLDLEKLVCWSVWETFNSDPINGWMRELEPSIALTAARAEVEDTKQDLPTNLPDLFSRVSRTAKTSTHKKEVKKSQSD